MMLYKDTKVNALSVDEDKDFFDIVTYALQGNTLAPYLFIIYLYYVLRTSMDLMKENGFTLAKKEAEDTPYKLLLMQTRRSGQIQLPKLNPCYLFWNWHGAPCEHRQKRTWGIIPTLKGGSLKLVDKLTYLGSTVSPTKNDINTWLAKAWTAIDKRLIIKMSGLSNKIKCGFFSKQQSYQNYYMYSPHWR